LLTFDSKSQLAYVICHVTSTAARSAAEFINDISMQVNFVLMVATEGYLKEIAPSDGANASSISSTITRNIFHLMKSELVSAGYVNRRFVPVLANGLHYGRLPMLFRNTKVYTWPERHTELRYFLSHK
jgi:hypothetical protein